jgi:uncharacterized protein YbjT (DUF2867 family)
MRIVVVGGSGRIGGRLVKLLRQAGHDVVAASPSSGVDTATGEGLAEALAGAAVVIDVTNPAASESDADLFFATSARNLSAAETTAGVGHHVVLSVVGTDRLLASSYFRGKLAQEKLVEGSTIGHTIVRSTQFFEFASDIAASATEGRTVRLPPALVRPVAADDVAAALMEVALGEPLDRTIELAGPESMRLDEFVGRFLNATRDSRKVASDPQAPYFGVRLTDQSLIPDDGARVGPTRLDDWLGRSVARV